MVACMAKLLSKKTVELESAPRPSRIRREPPQPDRLTSLVGKVNWSSREWEIRLAIAGIIFFALGVNAVVLDLGIFFGK